MYLMKAKFNKQIAAKSLEEQSQSEYFDIQTVLDNDQKQLE